MKATDQEIEALAGGILFKDCTSAPVVPKPMRDYADHWVAIFKQGYRAAEECAALAAPQGEPPKFPTMLRKMWSGGEVQQWINENWEPK